MTYDEVEIQDISCHVLTAPKLDGVPVHHDPPMLVVHYQIVGDPKQYGWTTDLIGMANDFAMLTGTTKHYYLAELKKVADAEQTAQVVPGT